MKKSTVLMVKFSMILPDLWKTTGRILNNIAPPPPHVYLFPCSTLNVKIYTIYNKENYKLITVTGEAVHYSCNIKDYPLTLVTQGLMLIGGMHLDIASAMVLMTLSWASFW